MEGKSKLKLRHIYLFFRFKKIYPDLFNYIITLINMKTKYLNFFNKHGCSVSLRVSRLILQVLKLIIM